MELKSKYRVSIIIMLFLLMMAMLLIFSILSTGLSFVQVPAVTAAAPSPSLTPSPLPTSTPEPTPSPEPTPALRERTELLILVNPWHEVPEDYTVELQQVTWGEEEDQYMDVRCADALLQMMQDCFDAGNSPYICSGYRTMEKQQYLFNNKIARLVAEGTEPTEAPAIAAMSVAIPGTSEHQLGLAVDIIDYNYPYLNEQQETMPTQKWLMENSWRYGFILRYPNDKSDITGIIYEPWHYRYVGVDAAAEIYGLGVTLEEYPDMFYEPLE